MKNYGDLNIYKDAHRLATVVHRLSLLLPGFEMCEEGSQIRRSSKAIIKGYGRKTLEDKIRYNEIKDDYIKSGKQINKFIGRVEGNWNNFESA